MNFIEAIDQVKQGKKVITRNGEFGTLLYKEGKDWIMRHWKSGLIRRISSTDEFRASMFISEWELYEE